MEFDFAATGLQPAELPHGYRWLAWRKSLLNRHAAVKFRSFSGEIDSQVFPCLGNSDGCRRLMRDITRQKSFLPTTTWLIVSAGDEWSGPADCATIQGLAKNFGTGAVQNVGVVPEHRGLGLGRSLVLQSLEGFRRAGLKRVYLEVTAENRPAVELYRSLGFRLSRTMYKPLPATLEMV